MFGRFPNACKNWLNFRLPEAGMQRQIAYMIVRRLSSMP
jgi:hypothetical protein